MSDVKKPTQVPEIGETLELSYAVTVKRIEENCVLVTEGGKDKFVLEVLKGEIRVRILGMVVGFDMVGNFLWKAYEL